MVSDDAVDSDDKFESRLSFEWSQRPVGILTDFTLGVFRIRSISVNMPEQSNPS